MSDRPIIADSGPLIALARNGLVANGIRLSMKLVDATIQEAGE